MDPYVKDFSFETDMETGQYRKWVEKYPEHIWEIFGDVILLGEPELEDIKFFQKEGVDIDAPCDIDPHVPTNALGHACEHRNTRLMRVLLEAGANPNLQVGSWTPLDSVVLGHSADLEDPNKLEEAIKLLLQFGVKRELSKEEVPTLENSLQPSSRISPEEQKN